MVVQVVPAGGDRQRVVFGLVVDGGFCFFSSRRRHTRFDCDWSSDVCSSDLSASVTVSNTDTQAPTAPTNVKASAANATKVNLTWTAATDNVGVTGYWVMRDGRSEERRVGKECRSRWSPYH